MAAIPGAAGDPRNRGSNGLLRAGAGLVESAADVLALLNRGTEFLHLDLPEPPPRCRETPATAPAGLGADEILVLGRLRGEPVHIDEIAIGAVPTLPVVIRRRPKDAGGIQSRPNCLQIPAWQPAWRKIVHVNSVSPNEVIRRANIKANGKPDRP